MEKKCNACEKSLVNYDGVTEVGISIENKKYIKVFGVEKINICWICFAKSFGVKELMK